MAMSPVKSSPTVPSIRIYQKKNKNTALQFQVKMFRSSLKGDFTWKGLELVR